MHDYTRREGNFKSIIDLTLLTTGLGSLESWVVDLEYSTLSDYKVISFSWENLGASNHIVSKQIIGWNINQLA